MTHSSHPVGRRAEAGRITLLLLGLVLLATPASAQARVDLSLRLEEGTRYRQQTTQHSVISTTVMGQDQTTVNDSRTVMAIHVREVSTDGQMTVEFTYESMAMQMSNPMMSIAYDSEDPPAVVPEGAASIAAMVGESFTLRFGPDGQVTESTGLAEMSERMLENVPGDAAMKEQLREQFGEETFGQMMQGVTGHLPDGPVSVGDSWQRSLAVGFGPIPSIEAEWTLTGAEGGVATLRGTSELGDGTETVQEMGPMVMRYSLTGTQNTSIQVDVLTGWTLRSEAEMEFSGTMATEMPGAGSINAPISMKSTTTVETIGE